MTICGFSLDKILVGLQRVGVLGLREAIQRVEKDHPTDREVIVGRLLEHLGRRNYIPRQAKQEYARALWREWLRHHGQDMSEVFSEVAVTVRGQDDDKRREFLVRVETVFAAMELRPIVTFAPPVERESNPQLIIADATLVRGLVSRAAIHAAIHRAISDW